MENNYLEENKEWIEYMVKFYGGNEDALQEVYVVLLKNEHKFDPTKLKFKSFANKYVIGTVYSYMKDNNLIHIPAHANDGPMDAKNIHYINDEGYEEYKLESDSPSPEDILLEKEKKDKIN